MKNNYLKFPVFVILCILSFLLKGCSSQPAGERDYYEMRIYHYSSPSQEAMIDNYLEKALLPALHRAGIPVAGVFKPVESDTVNKNLVYVFIPYQNLEEWTGLPAKLEADQEYAAAGRDFLDAPYNNPPFDRYETVIAQAFSNMPRYRIPSYDTPRSERIYEYRSYESATEAKAAKKIQMFNEGEMQIFEKVGSNAVFYAKVISGSQMPRLLYMTTYADMKSHDEHWAAFRASDEWKEMSGLEEYRNTVSKANPFLLYPTSYSDF